ncbi:MAG: 16S rRNA (cytosine(1402)-N(4))-methyltransferase RsmH [Candidatus Daviesbacteria bacterium]|nr:16S rRNA (cytosine(1402)-N(4))-methyltransferase RsmH [Candidatus Daviesbacteria bacterium]
MEGYHRSVLLKETVDALVIKEGRWYLDLTLGDAGHSIEIISRGGKVVGIDVDPQALSRAQKRFKDLEVAEDKYKLILGNFRDLKNLIQSAFAKASADKQTELRQKFAGAIFDLGVSSLQLESPERGFSFGKSGPLDMRMDPSLNVEASDLVNSLTRKELYELFAKMGEEKYSWAVAGALVLAREVSPITNTLEFAEIVERVVGGRGRKIFAGKVSAGKHPATRVFQALRIAVNDELNALKEGLSSALDLIEKDGRIAVISFHSLEDRIVKNTFKAWETAGTGQVLTKKPVVPNDAEVAENSKSRSAKMRVFKRL